VIRALGGEDGLHLRLEVFEIQSWRRRSRLLQKQSSEWNQSKNWHRRILRCPYLGMAAVIVSDAAKMSFVLTFPTRSTIIRSKISQKL
jgi:hypothetical protein